MTQDWESTFSRWATPPSQTEQDRLDNAVRAIRDAINDDDALSSVTKIYLQGSYRNRVNVRQDSDVDIGVLYTGGSFCIEYPEGMGDADFDNVAATYTYSQFKNDIGNALIQKFGSASVHRGNKAFDISANTYRVDADVVPTFVHHRYKKNGWYICGVQLNPDNGGRIINWPERLYDDPHWLDQHYENGVTKNTATGRRYKGVVRILKKLRNEMDDEGIPQAAPIKGFTIECLAWNVPDGYLGNPTWDRDVQKALRFLWNNTDEDKKCEEWGEVSELKYLFRPLAEKRKLAHAFLDAAWDYIGVRK